MQVRHAIAAVTVAALAFALSACSSDPQPTATNEPATTTQPDASVTPTAEPTTPSGPAKMREITKGYDLAGTATSLRTGFPSFANLSDDEIAVILNAGCDGIDATGTPQGGADEIQTHGIEVADAAFGVLASITLYCPEYSEFLRGS